MKNTVGVILIGLASLIAAPQGTFDVEDAVLYDVQIETTKTQNQVLTHLQAKMNSIENYISKEHSYAK